MSQFPPDLRGAHWNISGPLVSTGGPNFVLGMWSKLLRPMLKFGIFSMMADSESTDKTCQNTI